MPGESQGVLQNVTGRGVREREAEGLPRPKEKNSRCRSFGEAWAFCLPGFCGHDVTERGTDGVAASLGEA